MATLMVLVAGLALLSCTGPGDGSRVATPERVPSRRVASGETKSITMYLPRLFADGSLGLQSVTRQVPMTDAPARDAMEALIMGPDGAERADNFQYALGPRTRIVGLQVDSSTAAVELDDEGLRRIHGRPFSELVYWSMVYTLTEVPGVERVALLRGGQPLRALGDPPFPVPPTSSRTDAPSWARPR